MHTRALRCGYFAQLGDVPYPAYRSANAVRDASCGGGWRALLLKKDGAIAQVRLSVPARSRAHSSARACRRATHLH